MKPSGFVPYSVRPLEAGPTLRERMQAEPDWATIEVKLRGGVTTSALAKTLQQRPAFAEVKLATLDRVLQKIKQRLIKETRFGKAVSPIPVALKAALEQLQGVPDIRKLEALVREQRKRVDQGITLEQKASLPLRGVREEMELLWKMTLSVIDAKQRLGLLHREPLKLEALLQQTGGSRHEGGPGRGLDAAGRQRVLAALKLIKRRRQLAGTEPVNGEGSSHLEPTE